MWKKIFAASAAAVGIAGILGSGSVFAAETPYNGEVIDITTTSPSICVNSHSVADYSGEPINAYMWNDNYSRQIVFERFGVMDCLLRPTVPSGTKLRFVIPMGIKNPSLSISDDGTYRLKIEDVSNNYLRSYGSTTRRIKKSTFDIQFDANGGTGTVPVITGATVGSSVTLPKSTLVRDGYRFAGWNTKADGTGTPYADEATISITEVGQIQLYAQWQGRAVLDSGANVNIKLKKLAGTNATDTSTEDSSIKAIKEAEALPVDFDTTNANNIISANVLTSPEPIYAWFDNSDSNNDGVGDGTIYIYTDGIVEGGPDMSYMFYYTTKLADISALSSWDTSSVMDMSYMFGSYTKIVNTDALETKQYAGKDYVSWDVSNVTDISGMFDLATDLADISALSSWDTSSVMNMSDMFRKATSLADISALSSWDTSSVIDMSYMFRSAASLADISALSSWDTSSVMDMSYMFRSATSLADISALSSWDTSSVTNMSYMFRDTIITNTDALETKQYAGKDYISWDTSSVTDMSGMFYDANYLADISALSSWDTSSVTNMYGMFYNIDITNTDALRTKQYAGKDYVSWNTSSVTDMSDMFRGVKYLEDVSALSSWDTSSVTNMSYMFGGATNLEDVSALSSWDTSSVTDMSYMFRYVPAHPLPSWYHE